MYWPDLIGLRHPRAMWQVGIKFAFTTRCYVLDANGLRLVGLMSTLTTLKSLIMVLSVIPGRDFSVLERLA